MYQLYSDEPFLQEEFSFHPDEQTEVFEIPFTINEPIEAITFGLKFNNRGKNTIRWRIIKEQIELGHCDILRRSITIRKNWASHGFNTCGELEGNWKVVIEFINLTRPTILNINIRKKRAEERWLKGDLHMHTTYSDGAFHVEEVMNNVKKIGLDFISMTDHNSFAQNTAYIPREDLVIIPGVEYSTRNGDSNIWGLSHWQGELNHSSEGDIESTIGVAKELGAVVSMNHPFIKNKPWKWNYDDFYCIEIWRGEWNVFNETALAYWHNRLTLGHRLTGVGGSDIHDENQGRWYGLPTTAVYTNDYSSQGILKEIMKGNVCVLAGPDLPCIQMSFVEDGIMCTFDRPASGQLKLINEVGIMEQIQIDDKMNSLFKVDKKAMFYRFELWGEEAPICITNPLYPISK